MNSVCVFFSNVNENSEKMISNHKLDRIRQITQIKVQACGFHGSTNMPNVTSNSKKNPPKAGNDAIFQPVGK